MSKWTLEKIFACDEIKTGCWVNREDEVFNFLYLKRVKNGFKYYNPVTDEIFSHTLEDCEIFRFFKSCGTEILPPKDKKKIKKGVWVNFYESGKTTSHISKETAKKFAYSAKALDKLVACEYFEREIEVEE